MRIHFSYRQDFNWSKDQPSRWRANNPGWPDPTAWIDDLYAVLEACNAVYIKEPDISLRRNKAAGILVEVLSALHALPPFANGSAHMALKDLQIFLQDLDYGRAHPWSRPNSCGGTNVTTTAEREVRQWAVALVHLVWMAGFRKTDAYKLVADTLTKSGRTGAKGEPVAWRSVQQWYIDVPKPLETLVGSKLSAWWQTAPCPHGQLITNCDTGKWPYAICAEAKATIARMAEIIWTLPNLRDRFHSPLSD